MRNAPLLVAGSLLAGCYVDVRLRGELAVGESSPPGAVYGALIEAIATAGLRVPLTGKPDYLVAGGVGGERPLMTSRSTGIDRVTGARAELELRAPKPETWPSGADRFEARFSLTSWRLGEPAAGAEGAEVTGSIAAVFGRGIASWSIGPSLTWWDLQRAGRSIGFGAEVGGRLEFDPRDLH